MVNPQTDKQTNTDKCRNAKYASKWHFRFFEVAGPKMARFLKNEFFCDLHAYFQDLNGRETLADQKWEMLPTLI